MKIDTKKEAKKLLKDFDVSITGDGNIVADQSPVGNTRYYIGGTIRLMMN